MRLYSGFLSAKENPLLSIDLHVLGTFYVLVLLLLNYAQLFIIVQRYYRKHSSQCQEKAETSVKGVSTGLDNLLSHST